jgi:hypothetical protein
MFSLSKKIDEIMGGYTLENESVDKNSDTIMYELKSIIPNEEILREFLDIAATIQNEKRNEIINS